jgi:hypothetical protein
VFAPPSPGAPGLVLPPDETITDRLTALLDGQADGTSESL